MSWHQQQQSHPPGGYYGRPPPANYSQPGYSPSGYSQPPPGSYSQPPPGGYSQPPPGSYSQPPPPPSGGYSQPPPGSYSQPPPPPSGGYSQPPPSGGYSQPPPGGYSRSPGGYTQSSYTQSPPPNSSYGRHYQQPPSQSTSAGSYQRQPPPSSSLPSSQSSFDHPSQIAPGYNNPGPSATGPPPGLDQTMWEWFQAVDTNKSGTITAVELREALLNNNWSHFNEETCRILIGMFDKNGDGTIDVAEFGHLWQYVQEWKGCFDRFDTDRSGNISPNELHQALSSFGYRLSMDFCQMCTRVFDRQDKNSMKFDDFIQCCVMLKSLTDKFKSIDTDQDGIVDVSYEQFLEMAIDNTIN